MKNNTLVALFLSLIAASVHAGGAPETLSEARQAELKHLLLHDCGSCHGMTLKGGLGPALTQEALADKPKEYLLYVISNGLPNTPMPPWKSILSEAEIGWLASTLKKGLSHDQK